MDCPIGFELLVSEVLLKLKTFSIKRFLYSVNVRLFVKNSLRIKFAWDSFSNRKLSIKMALQAILFTSTNVANIAASEPKSL